MSTKVCPRCQCDLPLDEYDKRKYRGQEKPKSLCRSCSVLYTREWRLKMVYGLTLDRFYEVLAAQHGGCAICAFPLEFGKGGKCVVVDHDHESGIVRGLLCSNCNRMIGMSGDSPTVLKAAAEYLQEYR